MVDSANIPGEFAKGLGNVLQRHLDVESGTKGDDFQIDVFTNDFEDEFPFDPDAPNSPYPTYSPEANRAVDGKPYGLDRTNRPKIHELNQPELAKNRGWRIIDFYPERNKKSEFYRLAGTPSEIRLLTQQIRHLKEIVKMAVGDFNFEEWFEEWEKGFPSFTNRFHATNTNIRTEFPASDYAGENGVIIEAWQKDISKRPTYIKWKEALQTNKRYLNIEYFPDRSQQKSIFLSGSEGDIIRHIIQYHYGGGGGGTIEASANIMTGGGVVKRKGRPQIVLWFKELREDVEPGFEAVYGRVTFRLMDKTDDPVVTGQQITWADLENYAQKIKTLFPSGYRWRKGKEQVVYHNWEQGYQLQLLCRSKTDGIELIQKILQIQDHVYDPRWCKHSVPENPAQAYPTMPEQITVLGQQVRRDRLRPIADVVFHHADLLLANWKKPIILVDPDGKIVPNRS